MPITTCIFDAYGTLFDVSAAARAAAAEPGREDFAAHWPRIAADWRTKQLEYSWLRAVAGRHVDFWQVTQDGLDWALEAAGLAEDGLRERLLALYWELPAYREVPFVLARLQAAGARSCILSNGNRDMLEGAVDSSGVGSFLEELISVEEAGVFKPARAVYDLVGARMGCDVGDVLFVSSNGWDIAGASAYGFETVWVNRAGLPVDRLMAAPRHIVEDLNKIPELT